MSSGCVALTWIGRVTDVPAPRYKGAMCSPDAQLDLRRSAGK